MAFQNKLFIGGEFVDAVDGATIEVLNPHDCSVLAEIAEARAADVDRAVEPAATAFPAWRRTAAADRGRLLLRLADAIEAHAEELATLESTDTGHPVKDSTVLDVPRTAACFRYFGGMADKVQGDVIPVEPGFLNYVNREPLGVVGQIVPVELPAHVLQLEDGSRARRRQHGGAQAERADSAVLAAPGRADGRRGLPARGGQHRPRLRAHGRASASPPIRT